MKPLNYEWIAENGKDLIVLLVQQQKWADLQILAARYPDMFYGWQGCGCSGDRPAIKEQFKIWEKRGFPNSYQASYP